MGFIWNVVELSATAFENYVVLDILEKMFSHRLSGRGKIISFYLTLALSTLYVTFINMYSSFEGWLALITIFIFVVYSAVFIEDKNNLKVLFPILLFSLIFGINIVVTYGMSVVTGMPDTFIFSSNDGIRLLAIFLTKFIFFVLTRAIIYLNKKELFRIKRSETIVTAVMLILTITVSICLVKLQINLGNKDELITFAVFCTLAINIFIILMIRRISSENRNRIKISVLKTQLLQQKNMMEETEHIGREIKKTGHDIKHHLSGILGMLETGKSQEAKKYIRELLSEYETDIFQYVFIENSAVGSILNLKIGRCHKEGIDCKVEIGAEFSGFSDTDICCLLANLFDNAIEASLKCNSPGIFLRIRDKNNYLCIELGNHVDSSVLESNSMLKTTKSDAAEHGFGIYSVSQIVEKYEGIKKIDEKNGFFIVDIWLKRREFYQTRQK